MASLHALPRVGMIVPKHRHSAVERNLVKRRLRELLRLEVLPMLQSLPVSLDMVVRVSPQAYLRSFAELSAELQQAGQRLSRMTFVAPAAALAVAPLVAEALRSAPSAKAPPGGDDVR